MTAIDSALNEINTAFQAASQEMYNAQAQSQAGGAAGNPFDNFPGGDPFKGGAPNNGGNSGNTKDGGVTDVDFEEVK